MSKKFHESVLLVEDQASVLKLLCHLVEAMGLEAIAASNGSEARDRLRSGPKPFLIVSDYVMPEMDGIELAKFCQTEFPTIPFVLLTGRADKELAIAGLNLGVKELKEKPLAPAAFQALVSKYLEARKASLEAEARELEEARSIFLKEAKEIVQVVETGLSRLDVASADKLVIDSLFRSVHTLKSGGASIPEGKLISELSHAMESSLHLIRSGKVEVDPVLIDLFYRSTDLIAEILSLIESEDLLSSTHQQRARDLCQKLKQANEDLEANRKPSVDTDFNQVNVEVGEFKPTISIDLDKMDRVFKAASLLVVLKNKFEKILNDPQTNDQERQKYKNLFHSLSQATGQLNQDLSGVRKVSFQSLSGRLKRLVRQVASSTQREVALELSGFDTETDKDIQESIGTCFTHLVRNAIDHGIESPEEREKSGKASTGKLQIEIVEQARRLEIKVKDDGRGLDIEKIKEKALQKSLISPITAHALPQEEIMRLIFEPGFSTSQVVSGISGRGVGMDAVLAKVKSLGGDIEIDSKKGAGCEFLITVPKRESVWVEKTLAVRSGSVLISIPLESVVSVESTSELRGSKLARDTVVQFQNRHWKLVNYQAKNLSFDQLSNRGFVAFLKSRQQGVAFFFDEIIGQFDIVVQKFNTGLRSQQGYRGLGYLNQEEISYVLDPEEFVSQCLGTPMMKILSFKEMRA